MTNKEWIEEYKRDLINYDKSILNHDDESNIPEYDSKPIGGFHDDYDQNDNSFGGGMYDHNGYEWDEPTIKHFQD